MKKAIYFVMTVLLAAGLSGCFDDGDLWNDVNDLKQRVLTLEEKISQMNGEIGNMQTIVTALNSGKVITNVTETTAGYTITFSGGSTITVNHGAKGADGAAGAKGDNGATGAAGAAAPVIGVADEGGVYYWTLTIEDMVSWLTGAEGEKLPVTGAAPVIGVDVDGYWTLDGVQLSDAGGQPVKASGKDGDSFFSDVTLDENAVTFTLAGGETIVIPRAGNLQLSIAGSNILFLKYEETATYPVTLPADGSVIITKPDGWKAAIQNGMLTVIAPPKANAFAEKDGTISITVVGQNAVASKTLTVSARDYTNVIDFEGDDVLDYGLAGPTSYGDNLYDGYSGEYLGYSGQYYGYYNATTGLHMGINETGMYSAAPTFFNGGIAISRWNDMSLGWYTNQCSVYYSDPVTGKGGYKGSETFAVHFGYNDPALFGDGRSFITFLDGDEEGIFDHFYVNNNTYACNGIKNGVFVADPLAPSSGWFRLIIDGLDKNGNVVSTVYFYMADFRTPESPGLITEWTPVDLRPLGKVHAIRLDMDGSDTGKNGLNTPAYFCFDNLAVEL
jgi:hypothetical protein